MKIKSFQIEEILATKLRALYQRNKGRDLFDMWYALKTISPDPEKIVSSFKQYMINEGNSVSGKEFITNLKHKSEDNNF